MIQSPLNYTGGKFRLLKQILPLFPQDIDTFIDLFCGGANVGCNVECNHVVFNDINYRLIALLRVFKENDRQFVYDSVCSYIDEYGLSWVYKNGYKFYGCTSNRGVGAYNKAGYLQLRDDFNKKETPFDLSYSLMLYVLIVFSFNNQLRFNSKGEFNLPVGKRDFNARMQKKLNAFIDRLHTISCSFEACDFRNFDFNALGEDDFVYVDPPYLITCATYNEQGIWTLELERELYVCLDELTARHIRFALSNVLSSKGKENTILLKWLDDNPQLICHHLNYDYSNSSYHSKDRTSGSDEVLITNY